MVPSYSRRREKAKRRTGKLIVPIALLNLIVLLQFPTPSYGQAASQEQPREPLGSLTCVGQVFVNDSAAPAESTIFSGDRLRTAETGTATFTVSGRGVLKVFPRSEVLFPGKYEFTAELKSGTVILTSVSGASGVTLRVGSFVLVSSVRQQSATTRVDGGANDSFVVSCLDGSVGVLTLESKSGQFLPAGRSLRISSGQAMLVGPPETNSTGHNFHSGWLYVGLAGAGAAVTAAELARGGGKQSISPSAP